MRAKNFNQVKKQPHFVRLLSHWWLVELVLESYKFPMLHLSLYVANGAKQKNQSWICFSSFDMEVTQLKNILCHSFFSWVVSTKLNFNSLDSFAYIHEGIAILQDMCWMHIYENTF